MGHLVLACHSASEGFDTVTTTISITEDNVLAALRGFLLGIVPDGVEVISSQDNRVPEPERDDFLTMTVLYQSRLSTNSSTYTDPGTNPGTRNYQQSKKITIQIDIHGPASADTTAMISTLFNDQYACDVFAASNFDIQPLYCDDGRQMTFINGENQFEQRWSIEAVLQYNPITSVPQDFADALNVNIISVDATYPT
ncbi:hypothetical protein AX768_09185 [Burkholderia sp. PAMC 28687]|nr:hypothetical protein AX768_09185 [Burkholderia sp. PAMC 28687]